MSGSVVWKPNFKRSSFQRFKVLPGLIPWQYQHFYTFSSPVIQVKQDNYKFQSKRNHLFLEGAFGKIQIGVYITGMTLWPCSSSIFDVLI